ncbi:MAG: hypothetical protein CMM18_05685 [Rhodospirillaceae bacterium]|nr:hypothetical protein [Rhodospirillaceae bacterium]|tara:strand:+ start:648 stop:1478 length:831 start_codon:yes stop_codon:yes gene_type:complete
MHSSLLVFKNFLYLKIASVLVAICILAYLLHEPLGQPNGGSWLGYTLGVISLILIFFLAWYGIRKRRYGSGKFVLEDWASAHVYLGIALLIITTLHSGFQFGLNIHTLAYVFMILVIASGLFGLYAYIRYPRLRTQNRGEATVGDVWELVASMSSECISIAQNLSDEIYSLVEDADKKTVLGGSFFKQLSGVDKNCSSTIALSKIKELAKNLSGQEAESARKLVTVMARKVELLNRIRKDIKYKAWLDVWLYIHIPFTVALLVSLIIHILVVFLYW